MMESFLTSHDVERIETFFDGFAAETINTDPNLRNTYKIQVAPGFSNDAIIAYFTQQDTIEYVEPEVAMYTMQDPET